LILWLIYTCLNFGTVTPFGGGESAYTESVVVRERERRKSHHSGSRRSRRASERPPSTYRP